MFRRIDQSNRLSDWIQGLSNFLARKRGLPGIIGIGLIVISLIFQVADIYTESKLIELLGVILLTGGILLALLGQLLADPLGK